MPGGAQTLGLGSSDADPETGRPDRLPAMNLLVEGSILQKILIPQYDDEKRLSSALRAEKLTLVNDMLIEARTVRLEFYQPDRSLRASMDLATARLQDQEMLYSDDPVLLEAEDLAVNGTALVYELRRSRGFLHGPATARTLIDTRTSMLSPPSPPRLGAAGIALIAAGALSAQQPDTLSDQELDGLDRLAVSQQAAADEARAEAAGQIETTETLATGADASLKDFLERAAVEIADGPKPDLESRVPDPEPTPQLKLPATIKADKGIFFDSETGLLIFLENVSLDHPEFTLKGADEVKVFMEPQKPKPAATTGADETAPQVAKFGDPTRIVATGTVVVERIDPGDGRKVKASGRQMLMDLKSNELIIRGGEPWILSDTANGRVVDPKGYIKINLKSGDASFVGKSRGFIETGKDN